jgi:hypothetical protein
MNFWKTFLPIFAVALLCGSSASAADNVFHYACKSEDARYALTVNPNRGIVKMIDHAPPHTLTTFRILKTATDECGKGGWILNDGAIFCYFTQGGGSLSWHGHEFDCDQADTE